jgi:hypothetical protein
VYPSSDWRVDEADELDNNRSYLERMSAGRTCCTNSSRELTAGRIVFNIEVIDASSGPICRRANVSRGANSLPWLGLLSRFSASKERSRECRLLRLEADFSVVDHTRGRTGKARKARNLMAPEVAERKYIAPTSLLQLTVLFIN